MLFCLHYLMLSLPLFPLPPFLRSETPQRPRTKLDEILESLTSPRLLERPPTGEKKEQTQEKPQQDKTFTVKGNGAPCPSAVSIMSNYSFKGLICLPSSQKHFQKKTSHLAPISPLWGPRLRRASPADTLSGVCKA